MKKRYLLRTLLTMVLVFICSIVITIIDNGYQHQGRPLFYHFIDYLFFTNLPIFIIGSVLIIDERGLFNGIIYATNRMRSVISGKYQYELESSEELEPGQISDFLKNKYLYRQPKYPWSLPLFFSGSLIMIGLLVYIFLFYGL